MQLKQNKHNKIKLILLILFTLTVTLVLVLFYNLTSQTVQPKQQAKPQKDTVKIASVEAQITTSATIVEPVEVEEVEIDDFVYYEHIPLKEDTQRYIWELSNEYDVAYTLVLAIAKVESNYDKMAISNTNDAGLYQLNKETTMDWLAEQIGLKEEFDWKNPKHSAHAAVWYLDWLRDYWSSKGYSDEDTFDLSIMSYNMGIGNMEKYLNKHGLKQNNYEKKVYDAKIELEQMEDNK
jgi:soluble lytic murein transglycosylase-like protein